MQRNHGAGVFGCLRFAIAINTGPRKCNSAQLKLSRQAAFFFGMLACFFLSPACLFAQSSDGTDERPDKKSDLEFEDLVLKSISRTGVLSEKALSESSGLARSAFPDSFWTINDSGHPSEVFLFRQDGKKLAQLKIDNAKNRDWEAMTDYADGDRQWVVIADVGDNQRLQKRYQLYYFLDPSSVDDKKGSKKKLKKLKSIKTVKIEFTYADDPTTKAGGSVSKDCEAVAVNPLTGDIWMTEKVYLNRDRKIKPGFYVLPAPKARLESFAKQREMGRTKDNSKSLGKKPLVANRIGSFPIRNVTGMSFSPDGQKLIVRNYLSAHLFVRPKLKNWKETVKSQIPIAVALPFQSQGEAICFTASSNSVMVTSEGSRQPVWKVDLQPYLDKLESVDAPESK
jgi:hypothetical protein